MRCLALTVNACAYQTQVIERIPASLRHYRYVEFVVVWLC